MPTTQHTSRWIALVVALVAIIVVLPAIVLLTLFFVRDDPGARSIDEAVDSFRNDSTGSIVNPAVAVQRPIAGVYESIASGQAAISFPPATLHYGDIAPVTVIHSGGSCWSTTVDFNTAYQQRWDYCFADGDLIEQGNYTSTKWDFGATSITNRSSFECHPYSRIMSINSLQVDDSVHSCSGTNDNVDGNTTSEITFEAIGTEELKVDSTLVATKHIRETDVLTGAQRGTTVTEYWYSPKDFLIVRMERHIDLRTASPVGDVTFKENGEWQLSSLTPMR